MCDPPGDPVSLLGGEIACNVHLVPYVVWPNASGLLFALPYVQPQGGNLANMFGDTIAVPLFIGAAHEQSASGPGWAEDGFDDLTVTLKWSALNNMSMPLTRGSPFVSAIAKSTPLRISSEQQLRSVVTDTGDGCEAADCDGASVSGSRFELSLGQSDETWVVYASAPVTFDVLATSGPVPESSFGGNMALYTSGAWSGMLRMALLDACTKGTSTVHCAAGDDDRPAVGPPGAVTAEAATPSGAGARNDPVLMAKLLDAAADSCTVGGRVDFRVERPADDDDDGALVLRYSWETASMSGSSGSGTSAGSKSPPPPLLLAMLPHHTSLIADAHAAAAAGVKRTGLGHRAVHGIAELVVGSVWELRVPLVNADWHAPRDPTPEHVAALKAELVAEAEWTPPANYVNGAGDGYNAGKLLSRMARTALIAEALGEDALAERVGKALVALVQRHAVDGGENPWVWDSTWGGLVSCGCDYDDCFGKCVGHCKNAFPNCPSLGDPGRDFGNAYYNDHHFHWGYHAYAAAVAAKFAPAWATRNRERLLLLARDIASPSMDDPAFPKARHKDWWMHISWASGIALAGALPYRNGRNQESSSEAVNGYYGAALMGKALHDRGLEDVGLALLSMEVHAARTYYHVDKDTSIYTPAMADNAMVGILWQNLAQYQTWFGPAAYLVHAIQIIPVTPVTEALLDPVFAAREWPVLAKSCDEVERCATEGWSPFVTMSKAVVEPEAAFREALQAANQSFSKDSPAGNGNSRLNTLYWIATRPAPTAAATALSRVRLGGPVIAALPRTTPGDPSAPTDAFTAAPFRTALVAGCTLAFVAIVARKLKLTWAHTARAQWRAASSSLSPPATDAMEHLLVESPPALPMRLPRSH